MPAFLPDDLARWTGGRWTAPPAGPVAAVAHDSRRVAPGALFVALRGERVDGHAFLAEAASRGAAAAVVDRAGPAAAAAGGLPLLVVDDTRRALADLARGHRARLRGRLIGVTGSVGKTTTKDLVADVLAAAGPTARTAGNWNNDIGLPLSLLAMDPDDAAGVFELGMNHPGELAPLCGILRPHWGVMTRVGPVHIGHFESEEAIADEKASLLRALPADGAAVLAADEPWAGRFRAAARCRVLLVGFSGDADYRGRLNVDPHVFDVTEPGGGTHAYRLPMPGEGARRNALRAVAVGREFGIAPGEIARRLAAFRPPPMRWDAVERDCVRWINDAYNANPESMREAARTFAAMPAAGRKWLVLGGMRELGRRSDDAHRALGRELAAGPFHACVAVGALARGIVDGARAAGWPAARLHACAGTAEAAGVLAGALRPGDAVLLKGSRAERIEDVFEVWTRRAAGDGRQVDRCCTS